MNYWWVNQKQTYRHEIGNGEGYLWSPKRQANGSTHFSYEYMRRVLPGDVIFSYANSALIAIGVAQTRSYSFPKPIEFGAAGLNWSEEGWKVNVKYTMLSKPLRTIDKINQLGPLLPRKYSPINLETGHGNQAYLFKIDGYLARALAQMIDQHAVELVNSDVLYDKVDIDSTIEPYVREWEDRVQLQLENDNSLRPRERETLVKARVGQGKFRADLFSREKVCRVTAVDKGEYLIASHIKPWRSANNEEKVDPENGFMLTPTIDHLFDNGVISFEDSGDLIISESIDQLTLKRLGVIGRAEKVYMPPMSSDKKHYLDWHRNNIFL